MPLHAPAHPSTARRLWLAAQARSLRRFALIVLGPMALVCLLRLGVDSPGGMPMLAQGTWYTAGLFVSGYLLAHRAFGAWRRGEDTASPQLMLPASVLAAQWRAAALIVLLLWPLLYTLGACLLYALVNGLAYSRELGLDLQGAYHAMREAERYRVFIPFIQPVQAEDGLPLRPLQLMLYLLYAMLTGYAAFTQNWFRRHAHLGALALGVVLGIISLLAVGLGRMEALFWWFERIPPLEPPGGAVYALNLVFWLGVPALLWFASWRALCEKELT